MKSRAAWLCALAAAIAVAWGVRCSTRPLPAVSGATDLPFYDTPDLTPRWAPVTHRIAAFDLRTQTGARVREHDLEGRIHVASFIFSACPSVCPLLVQRLLAVERATRAFPDVVLVSYSVTPQTDTPDVLAEFGRVRGIRPDRWLLITGAASQIAALARRSYFATDPRESADGGDRDRLLHTEKVLLVDRKGRLRGVYNGTQAFEMQHLLEDIRALLRAGG